MDTLSVSIIIIEWSIWAYADGVERIIGLFRKHFIDVISVAIGYASFYGLTSADYKKTRAVPGFEEMGDIDSLFDWATSQYFDSFTTTHTQQTC